MWGNDDLSLSNIVICSVLLSIFIRKELFYSIPFKYMTLKCWVLFK